MTSRSQFQEYYASVHEDELVYIALTRELMPEAQEALRQELSQRGITDLTAHRQQMAQEQVAEDQQRQAKLAHRSNVTGWLSKFLYAFGGLVFLYGVYCAVVPQPPGEDGTLFIVLGPAIMLIGWVKAKASKIWDEKVLFRKPPL